MPSKKKTNHKWPSDFGLYKQDDTKTKSLMLKVAILGTATALLLFTVLYTTIYAINSIKKKENNNTVQITPLPRAEKLIASQVSVEKQEVEHISPQPFINDLRGPAPSRFTPPYGYPSTTHTQFVNHRPKTHPNNIQDIIQYLTDNAHRQKDIIREQQLNKLYGSKHKQQKPSHFSRDDPFFAFKPQDPSDINLLAPSSFRFAPAIVSSGFYKDRQQLVHEVEQINDKVEKNYKKPIKLTLSIYPTHFGNQFVNSNRVQYPGPTPRYRYPVASPGRMIVHLNVYPGANNKVSTEQEKEVDLSSDN